MEEQFKSFFIHYDFHIYPTEKQKELFAKTFGACRYVYNKLLPEVKAEYETYEEPSKTPDIADHKKTLSRVINLTYKLRTKLDVIKSQEETAWLNDVSDIALRLSVSQLVSDFERSYKDKKDYPEFKKKRGKQSFFLTSDGFKLEKGEIYLDKFEEPLSISYPRELPSEPNSFIITETSSNEYYIKFSSEPTSLTITKTPSNEYYISFSCANKPN
jgi:putative transposase